MRGEHCCAWGARDEESEVHVRSQRREMKRREGKADVKSGGMTVVGVKHKVGDRRAREGHDSGERQGMWYKPGGDAGVGGTSQGPTLSRIG